MTNRRSFLKKSLVIGGGILTGGIFYPIFKNKNLKSIIQNKLRPKFFSRQEKLMGTWISISCYSANQEKAETALIEAFREMKLIDQLMSIHKPKSQISLLNAHSGRDPIVVDSRVTEVLNLAKEYSKRSNQSYDVTILPLMRLFGFYGHAPSKIPSDYEITQTLKNISSENIQVNYTQNDTNGKQTSTVQLIKHGSVIDLGSIGKGYAVDRAIQVLKSYEITSALVNAGGNIFALGAPEMDPDPRQKWTIGIRDPKNMDHILKTIYLRDQGVATSGIDQTFVKIGSKEIGHIFNAVNGQTAQNYSSSTAIASTATVADILSTTSFILGDKQSKVLFPEAQFEFFLT